MFVSVVKFVPFFIEVYFLFEPYDQVFEFGDFLHILANELLVTWQRGRLWGHKQGPVCVVNVSQIGVVKSGERIEPAFILLALALVIL